MMALPQPFYGTEFMTLNWGDAFLNTPAVLKLFPSAYTDWHDNGPEACAPPLQRPGGRWWSGRSMAQNH